MKAAKTRPCRAHERADRNQSGEQQRNFDVVDDAVSGRWIGQRAAERAAEASDDTASRMPPPSAIPPPAAVACTAPHVPSANPLSPSCAMRHRGRQRARREQPAAEADQRRADPKQQHRVQRRREDHRGEGEHTRDRAEAGDPIRIGVASQGPCGKPEARQRAERKERGQRRGLADGEFENFGTVGLEQNVLHREGRGAERHRDKDTDRTTALRNLAQEC